MSFKNVVLGISGGVDSAVAGLLLKQKGFRVFGVFMKNWDLTDENGVCSAEADLEDAKYVCGKLKIPFHEVNFVKEYWNDVFLRFVSEYELGWTPNPDVLCNKYIKFKAFYDYAVENLNADAIATGHYAKTSFGDYLEKFIPNMNVKLLKPRDYVKDQTLFLSQVPQIPLRKTMFPLGSLVKETVKQIAADNGLRKIAQKPESTGICFIGNRNFPNFISEYIPPKPGKFIDVTTGKVVGEHKGQHMYTLGQRSRLTLSRETYYVVKKIPKTSDILVAPGRYHPINYRCSFFTEKPHWIADPPDLEYKSEMDFRFQHICDVMGCTVVEVKSGELYTVLKKPFRSLTPGQFAVYYQGDECLGSAKITQLGPSEFALGKTIPKGYIDAEEKRFAVFGQTC